MYTYDEETQKFDRAIESSNAYVSTMSILSHNNHCMYITDPERFAGMHACPKYPMVFAAQSRLHNHKRGQCEKAYIKKFVKQPTLFRPPINKMARLFQKYGVKGVDPYTDHYLVFDFEAILKHLDSDKASKRLTFTNAHIPVSVSVHDSLTDEAKCFVNEHPKELLLDMFTHAAAKRELIVQYNKDKYKTLIEKIELRKDEAQKRWLVQETKIAKSALDWAIKDVETITDFCETIPLIGFNSGRYDLNLIKDKLFVALLHVSGMTEVTHVKEAKEMKLYVSSILSSSGYMCRNAGGYKMLNISKYVAAGTSLRQYLKAYLGKCKCPDKIKCECQMSKGHFPYEYLSSFEMLDQPGLPPRSAFNSSLRSTKISDKAWKRVQWVWEHYQMKTLRELLIWYNNLDVIPFSRAIREQMKFFRDFSLDMFCDGVSLPGLAEKIMYSTVYDMSDDKSYIKPRPREAAKPFEFGKIRFNSYKRQDEDANRTFDMTLEHLNKLLKSQHYLCALCYESLTKKTASADRINNFRGHENGNIQITCSDCNIARKDMNIHAFRRQKLLEYNADRLIHSIDEEQSEIWSAIS